MKGTPMQRNFGIGKEARLKRQGEKGDANELVAKRTKLKEKKEKREAKGKNTKFLDNRIDKNQTRIDNNPEAISWSKNKKPGGKKWVSNSPHVNQRPGVTPQ